MTTKMGIYNVLIDDVRYRDDVDIIARTPRSARAILMALTIDKLYLDHDLGPEGNVYEVLKMHLMQFGELKANEIHIVSANPVGAENMVNLLVNDSGYRKVTYNYLIKR